MARVLAGSEEDLRWRTMSPDKPQTENPPKKRKKSEIIKEITNKNAALSQKLNDTLDENIALRAKIAAFDANKKNNTNYTNEKLPEKVAPVPKPKGEGKSGRTGERESGRKGEFEPAPEKVVKKVAKKVIKKTARTRRR